MNPPATHPATDSMRITAESKPATPLNEREVIARARAFAEPLLGPRLLDTGENVLMHADAMCAILQRMQAAPALQASAYLIYVCDHLTRPQELIAQAFGDNLATLAVETTKLVRVQRQARLAWLQTQQAGSAAPVQQATQTENVRKMLLAFSRDLRVVLLRLVSRLQTLRFFAHERLPIQPGLAQETMQVFAPLANRLGIHEIKWELEDLSLRFLEPQTYREVAHWLDAKRVEREAQVEQLRTTLARELAAQGLQVQVSGRPKHIYSIVKKMRGKSLAFDQVYDLRALRVIVPTVADCYRALSWVHTHFTPIPDEFDDYIARPKPNGYQSLHTVVRDALGRPAEIQIRTQAMHDHAEHGVAAHWAYKEAGSKGYAGVSAGGSYDTKIAMLRQLLAWQRDITAPQAGELLDDRIYVLTPDASIVELPQGATPVDFAYSVHTSLGHRCRGAKVDGAMVPLQTPLKNGQTVEIIAAKEGGPSRDWLNPELGYLASHRARTKVRAWFNALALQQTIAKGREAVEKLLQREGKTAVKLDDLALQLGFANADALFESVGKDEFSLRAVEQGLRPPAEPEPPPALLRKSRASDQPVRGGLLVVGVDDLMTQMAKCCKPAPPDPICGFVTRGRGVSVHRQDCSNLRELQARHGDRLIDVEWGVGAGVGRAMYPVDVFVQAQDRHGLLRDISEVFTKEKMNVTGVQTQTIKGVAWMTFTVEVSDAARLHKVLALVGELPGVRWAQRK
ncbi:MAG: bifunctional (p)ppGpp synthetase/guanosine-3',5'-bis(diphosphate) 3'-pyrophosphohydrolase [Rhodoferax sp.]